jgi:hypothetical protein
MPLAKANPKAVSHPQQLHPSQDHPSPMQTPFPFHAKTFAQHQVK